MKIKVNGSWKDGAAWVKVNGRWRKGIATWIKINGTWRKMTYAFNKVVFNQQITDLSYPGVSRYGTADESIFEMSPSDYPCTSLKFFTTQEDRLSFPGTTHIDIIVSDLTERERLYTALSRGRANIILKGFDGATSTYSYSNSKFAKYEALGNIRIVPRDPVSLYYFLRRNRGRTIEMTVNIND